MTKNIFASFLQDILSENVLWMNIFSRLVEELLIELNPHCQINHSLYLSKHWYMDTLECFGTEKSLAILASKSRHSFLISFKKNDILVKILLQGFQTELSVWIRFMKINSIHPFSFQLCNQSLPRLYYMYQYIACIIF